MKMRIHTKWMGCLLALTVGLLGQIGYAQRKADITTIAQLTGTVKQPDHSFGSAPLWVWHTDVTESIIDSMMRGFKRNAFGGVFIHPRPGLVTPYLSAEWNRLFTYSVAKGKELGLDVWIYDENSYPSGFAGGHVPASMPESYNQGQMLNLTKAKKIPLDTHAYLIILRQTPDGFIDISDQHSRYADSPGTYYLFKKAFYGKSPWYAGFSYVDLLHKGVTEKFIEVTMKGYEKSFGKEFGRVVPGIFTDEPNIEVQGRDNIRWTPDLFDRFRERWGYDLVPHLPSLYEEVGEWRKIRHNYYQVLLQLFIDRWSKPWHAYTEKKGLEWTGHYWEHGWPNPNHGGDNMAMYAWHQRPAIDMLFNQFNEESPNAQFGNIRAVKELASVANQLGRKRTLSETYGGGGWELTLTDMKRLGDWEYVLGVNTLNQHLADMTLVGARKYDYPQSFSYHNPWWPYYASQNRYFARLSLALSAGKQVNDILVIEPTTSAWMYSTYQSADPRRDTIGYRFQSFVTTLERAQAEYDLGSENIIKDHGQIRNARFVVGERDYRTVVIPPGMENIDRITFDLLLQFAKQGGNIVLFESIRYIDGTPAAAEIAQLKKGSELKTFPQLDEQVIRDHFLREDIVFSNQQLIQPHLYHHRRMLQDGQLLFLVNSSMDEEKEVAVDVQGKQVLYVDTETGDVLDFPSIASGAYQSLRYTLPPAGSALFLIANQQKSGYPAWKAPALPGREITSARSEVRRLQPNVLTIDFCDVAIGDTLLKDIHTFYAADTVFKHYGFADGNPWNTSVQYRDQTIQRDTFEQGTGFTASYHFQVAAGTELAGLRAAVERPHLWQVSVNGQVVSPRPNEWWLDHDFAVFDIGQYCKTGNNTLTIQAMRMSVHAEIEPVYILGNFSLHSLNKGWGISPAAPLKLGSWKDQGMPFYGHEVAYIKHFEGKKGQSYVVKLADWKGTAALVKLNGKQVGHVHYPPYQLEINEGVQDGQNELEVIVVGSLKNTLGPHHGNPQPGMVSPWHWRNAHVYPAGSAYDTYDYGLIADFEIREVSSHPTLPVKLNVDSKEIPTGITAEQLRFGWQLESVERGVRQTAWQIKLAMSDQALEGEDSLLWDSGKVPSDEQHFIPYQGSPLTSGKMYYWKVRIWDQDGKVTPWSTAASFVTGILHASEWEVSKWIGYESLPPELNVVPGVHGNGDNLGEKAVKRAVIPYFRRSFTLNKPVAEAYLFVSGLGHYEASLNGENIGDHFLAPGWTTYEKRCLYNTYSVKEQLRQGENVLGGMVGTGFRYVNRERYRKLVRAEGYPMLRAKLLIRYTDGTSETIGTDDTWRTAQSPITFSSIYGGEDYDATREQPGWNMPGFPAANWKTAQVVDGPTGSMEPERDYPLKVMEVFEPTQMTEVGADSLLYDFGQNASGIIRLAVKGKKGDKIRITPAEILDDNGLPYQGASGSPYYFEYIVKGTGDESWQPRFTYYGFRYALVTVESEEKLDRDKIRLTMLHTRNSAPEVGMFNCSNPLFNQINELIRWGIRSNLASVATDCPHREKLGWLEQTHLIGASLRYNYDCYNLYSKIVDDMLESQLDNGLVPDIVPEYVPFEGGFRDSPEWGSAAIIIPWYLYQWYGDRSVLERAYPMMTRYLAYLGTKADGHLLSHGLGDWFDLGPAAPGVSQLTPIGLTASTIYYYDAALMARIAGQLALKEDSARYQLLADRIRSAFNAKYFDKTHAVYATGSQTSYAMPLYLGLVDSALKQRVEQNLVDSIVSNGRALTAGDVGYRYLLRALENAGASQLIYEMNNRDDVPGYGYQIRRGATALTESWAALRFVSNNHMMLGHLMEWLYSGLLGIRSAEDGLAFKSIEIRPAIIAGLPAASGRYDSPYGPIEVAWSQLADELEMKVCIPPNTQARIYVPHRQGSQPTEGGREVSESQGIEYAGEEGNQSVFKVGSGTYVFKTEWNLQSNKTPYHAVQ